MYETNYHRASSVADAVATFAKGTESKFLAGGQTLLPVMKQRLAAPSDVLDLSKVQEMIGIEVSGGTVTIKAATPHYDVAQSDAVKKAIPALANLASMIGDPAVRYRGTIGGSLASNDPAADYPAAVLALGATPDRLSGNHHACRRGRRQVHPSDRRSRPMRARPGRNPAPGTRERDRDRKQDRGRGHSEGVHPRPH